MKSSMSFLLASSAFASSSRSLSKVHMLALIAAISSVSPASPMASASSFALRSNST